MRTYIILPSTIWGIAKNPLTDAGLANPHSQQIPKLIYAALGRGRAGVVGKGLALWPDVHIDDGAYTDPSSPILLLIRSPSR